MTQFATGRSIASTARANQLSSGCLAIFFAIFGVAGLGFLIPFFLMPAARIIEARSWRQTPCTILSSNVATHHSSDGNTYRIEVRFRYEVDGRAYESNRYDFSSGSSSGYKAKQQVVKRYPPGSRSFCYVDPANPDRAVIEPGFTSGVWVGAIPLVFVLFGFGGVTGVVLAKRRRRFGCSTATSRGNPAPRVLSRRRNPVAAGPIVLAGASPALKAMGFGIFALIWNVVVAVLFLKLVDSAGPWSASRIVPLLFLIPFALVGLGLLLAAGYCTLAIANPRVRVTLSRGVIAAGDSVELRWEFAGRYDRIERLRIWVEGREQATYRRGTDTRTDRNVFARLELTEKVKNFEVRSGTVRLIIPAGAAPTFYASNNQVRWFVVVHGQIPRWPDVRQEFEIEVAPSLTASPAPAAPPSTAPANSADLVDAIGRLSIQLQNGQTAFCPGEPVRGIASWDLAQAATAIEIRLLWYTRGKGTVDVQTVDGVNVTSPAPQDQKPFQFSLPQSPCSFSGKLISLIWAVELVVQPGERAQRIDLIVAPAGQELRLDALGAETRP